MKQLVAMHDTAQALWCAGFHLGGGRGGFRGSWGLMTPFDYAPCKSFDVLVVNMTQCMYICARAEQAKQLQHL